MIHSDEKNIILVLMPSSSIKLGHVTKVSGSGHPFKWTIPPCCLSVFVSHQILCACDSVLCIHTCPILFVKCSAIFSLFLLHICTCKRSSRSTSRRALITGMDIFELAVSMSLDPLSFICAPIALALRASLFTMLGKTSHAQRGLAWSHSSRKSKRVDLRKVESPGD